MRVCVCDLMFGYVLCSVYLHTYVSTDDEEDALRDFAPNSTANASARTSMFGAITTDSSNRTSAGMYIHEGCMCVCVCLRVCVCMCVRVYVCLRARVHAQFTKTTR